MVGDEIAPVVARRRNQLPQGDDVMPRVARDLGRACVHVRSASGVAQRGARERARVQLRPLLPVQGPEPLALDPE
eukprot:1203462-Pyramimonas_sp.AAC.1